MPNSTAACFMVAGQVATLSREMSCAEDGKSIVWQGCCELFHAVLRCVSKRW
eukprot:m.76792 g.76792  ORF g.76792 m.76792 type:complete len:52 (+) comp14524_c0_seq2:1613-1768(+)